MIKKGLIVLGRVWKDPGVSCRVWEAVTGSRRVWISMTDLHWYGRVHEGLGWYPATLEQQFSHWGRSIQLSDSPGCLILEKL